mmetsp:Transcript_20408/g.37939  ORF Transcript_20408/g.37939 Transcript_20408/m.37939 type:complete len:228 (-) Transcript_20408:218-901(-)
MAFRHVAARGGQCLAMSVGPAPLIGRAQSAVPVVAGLAQRSRAAGAPGSLCRAVPSACRWFSTGSDVEAVEAPPRPSKVTTVDHILDDRTRDLVYGKEVPVRPEGLVGPLRFAVIEASGTQFKVAVGDELIVTKLRDAEVGTEYTFDRVLLVGEQNRTYIGRPLVTGAKVKAFVEEQTKDAKVIVMKRRRKNHSSRTTQGHRRKVTFLRITKIEFDEQGVAPPPILP